MMIETDAATGKFTAHGDVLRRLDDSIFYSVVGAGRLDAVWIDESSLLDASVLADALRDPGRFALRLSGGILVTVIDHHAHRAVMITDPLGAASLLTLETEDTLYASSNIELIYGRTVEKRAPLQREPNSIASMLVTGVTGMGWVPYRGVQLEPVFSALEISDGTFKRWGVDFASVIEEVRSATPSEVTEMVRKDISANLRAAASAQRSWKISHLTGGFDSRLVLAFLKSENLDGEFAYACHGTPAERDREVFEILARHLNLQVAPAKYRSVSGTPESFEEELTLPLDYSWGMSLTGPTKYSVPQDGMILSGGWGSLFRSSYWHSEAEPNIEGPGDVLNILYGATIRSLGGDFVNDRFLGAQEEVLWEYFKEGKRLGLTDAGALEYIFIPRNRMFVGLQSHLQRQFVTRFDPLYSVASAAWGLVMSTRERQENLAGISLMKSTAPDLLALPFDTPRFDESTRRAMGIAAPIEPKHQDAPLNLVSVPTQPTMKLPSGYMPKATPEQIAFAREKKASLRHVVWSEPVRSKLGEMVSRLSSDSAFSEAFNVPTLRNALKKPFPNRIVMRTMINLYALFLWYGK